MIHLFHGLFGDTSSWQKFDFKNHLATAYNLYHLTRHDLNEIKFKSDDIVIGYSMGGRIAIQLAALNGFRLKKLILLSAHPGLKESEKQERKKWEDEIISKMRSSTVDSFFKFWNSLPIFSTTISPQSIDTTRFTEAIKLFDQHRLSAQVNYKADLIRNKDKVLYLYGERDPKYRQIAHDLKNAGLSTFAIDADHRLLLAKNDVEAILHRETLK